MSGRLAQAFSLTRDWIAPGEALAQWTHFVTSVCNARCAHCFYPINAGKNELTFDEIDRLTRTLPPIRLLLIGGGEPFLRRDLSEVVRLYFDRTKFFTCSIPTNGFGPDEITRAAETICGFDEGLSLGLLGGGGSILALPVLVYVARGWQVSGTGRRGLEALLHAPIYLGWRVGVAWTRRFRRPLPP